LATKGSVSGPLVLTDESLGASGCTLKVTVLRSRYEPGGSTEGVSTVSCVEALLRHFRCDAHMQLATSPLGCRLTAKHVGQVPITLGCIASDWDAPNHEVTPAWRVESRELVTKLFMAHSGYYYETRGGGRLLWMLAEPFEINSANDAAQWRARYLAACDWLTTFGIIADRSCSDWQRLFRLPHSTRDPGGKPENLPVIGSVDAIGAFKLPPANQVPRPVASVSERHGSGVSTNPKIQTPLLDALVTAQLVLGDGPVPGSLRIICPRDKHHTTAAPGCGSTLYYPPDTWDGSGWIHCLHDHCSGMRTAAQWRRAIAAYTGHRGSLRSPASPGT
jgi:hypothetical protein